MRPAGREGIKEVSLSTQAFGCADRDLLRSALPAVQGRETSTAVHLSGRGGDRSFSGTRKRAELSPVLMNIFLHSFDLVYCCERSL